MAPIPTALRLLCVATSLWCAAAARAQDNDDSASILFLADGDFVTGNLADHVTGQPAESNQSVLRWQSEAFTRPFEFRRAGVKSIQFPHRGERQQPEGDFSLELVQGDLLFGTLVGMSGDRFELQVPRFGRIHVDRDRVVRMLRLGNRAGPVYVGPNSLEDWDDSSTKDQWHEEAGHLITEQKSAFLHGDFGLPAQAVIEFEISWTSHPNFIFALGAGGADDDIDEAFRFEVWDYDLVVVRQQPGDADVASVMRIGYSAGRVRLLAYLDQPRGRLYVLSPEGEQLAALSVSGGKEIALPSLRLINKRGNVRLERLRISRWNGEPPRPVQADSSRIHRADGSIVYGKVTQFDGAAGEFMVATESGDTRVDVDDVESVVLNPSDPSQPSTVRAVLRDGTRFSGKIVKVEDERLWLNSPAVDEALALPVADLHSILVLDHKRAPKQKSGRPGRLELPGVRLNGVLAANSDRDESCLVWQPHASAIGSPLKYGASGRIVYREPRTTSATRRRQPQRPAARRLFGGRGDKQATQRPSKPRKPPAGRALHLRSGDTIPCTITSIDERGVSFETPLSDSNFAPHDQIKAVGLDKITDYFIEIDEAKRGRLLTLPRMQRTNPPTHLIRSKNGDYLRARLIAMDKKTLTVEVRLETRQIPRANVSRIIWLHGDELESAEQTPAIDPTATALRVQALRRDGITLTFLAEQSSGVTVFGTSQVLGACQVDVDEVDQFLIGTEIERNAAQLAYQQWKLENAVEPRFVTAVGEGSPGTESAMVGQPAPDFQLKLLDGKKFQLSGHKGQIVVLDFWATWCGPCIQAMPQVDAAVHEVADQDVILIAVNLEEQPEQIRSTLERMELSPTVALDQDGVVATLYNAVAIPQTVIIDREGNVARVFVGGGPNFGDQLRESLTAVLAPTGQPDASE